MPRLCAKPPAPARVVVPSPELARHLERHLLPPGLEVQGPCFISLSRLIEEALARAGPERPRRVSEPVRRRMLAWLIRSTLGERDFLGQVRRYPGFVMAVGEFLEDLQQAGIPPSAVVAVAEQRHSRKLEELARIYAAYRHALSERGWVDRAGELEAASKAIRTSRFLAGVDPVVVFGFDDFTAAQESSFRALAEVHGSLVWMVPFDASRPELFERTAETLRRLEVLLGTPATPLPEGPRPPGRISSCAHAQAQVFARDPRPAESDGTLSLLETCGPAQMVEALARELRRCRRDDPTLKWSDCAVVFRSLAPYRALVQEIFPRFGVPFRLSLGTPWRELHLLTWLRTLLGLKQNGFAREPLLACLGSVYCRGLEDRAVLPRLAASLPSHVSPSSLGAALQAVAEGWERAAQERFEEEEPDPTAAQKAAVLRAAAQSLPAALQTIADLPDSARFADYAAGLQAVIRAWLVQPPEAAEPPFALPFSGLSDSLLAAQERQVLADLEAHLQELGRGWPEPVSFREFLESLELLQETERCPEPPAPAEAVSLHDVFSVRGLSFRLVILGGLLEKEFPAWARPSPFLDDGERGALMEAAGPGARLPLAVHQPATERLLFVRAIDAATERLVLAYPRTDGQGRPTVPSPFVAEVKQLFAPDRDPDRTSLPLRTYTLAEVLPRSADDLWRAEEIWAWRLENGEWSDLHSPFSIRHPPSSIFRSPPGLAAEWARWRDPDFTAYDGDLSADPDLVSHWRRELAHRPWSPTQLDRFGECPWRFFAGQVLGLRPVEEEPLGITPLDRGRLFHTILERFYRSRWDPVQNQARPLTEAEAEPARTALLQVAEEVCAAYEEQGRVGPRGAWHFEKQRLFACLERFVRSEILYFSKNPGFAPRHLEVSFGLRERGGRDPASTSEPLGIATESGQVWLRGVLDRVDVDGTGKARVIDYKTGSASSLPTASEVRSGLSFQLLIYLLAAEGQLRLDPLEAYYLLVAQPPGQTGGLPTVGRLSRRKVSRSQARGLTVAEHPEWPTVRAVALSFLAAYTADIAAGFFPVLPYPRNPRRACRHCEFRRVCRIEEGRVLGLKAGSAQRFARIRAMEEQDRG